MLETQEYTSILVGVDGSAQAEEALEKAISVALRNNAKIVITHIIENSLYGNMGYSLTNAELLQMETDRSEEMLADYRAYAEKKGCQKVETVLTYGAPKTLMASELPTEYHSDLIMVGQSGLNAMERLVMGSVSDYVIRNATCDVLVVRPSGDQAEPIRQEKA